MISGASGNKEANQLNPIQNNSSQNYAKKIVLASKGESGYSPIFDVDNNGIITLDEFNKYCEENGVKEEDKLKLMMSMQSSKIKESFTEKEEDDSRIYARKGDKKYVEEMDEDKNSIVTYDEYIKYCQKYANSNEKEEQQKESPKDLNIKNALKAYTDNKIEQVQIEIDSEA
ncbi:MAG: hypothetical protein IKL52_04825 [Candidatus Gastranaerophilales bacterium]|nr:hypothetical protein [Candidatus Gastranaerophilales bacterium]